MASAEYRIESDHPITNRLLPRSKCPQLYVDPSDAVAIAAKCVPNSFGDEIRVVHVPSGEVVFRIGSMQARPERGCLNDFDPLFP